MELIIYLKKVLRIYYYFIILSTFFKYIINSITYTVCFKHLLFKKLNIFENIIYI